MTGVVKEDRKDEIKYAVWSERALWKKVNEQCAAAGITCKAAVGECKPSRPPALKNTVPDQTTWPVPLEWEKSDNRQGTEYTAVVQIAKSDTELELRKLPTTYQGKKVTTFAVTNSNTMFPA